MFRDHNYVTYVNTFMNLIEYWFIAMFVGA